MLRLSRVYPETTWQSRITPVQNNEKRTEYNHCQVSLSLTSGPGAPRSPFPPLSPGLPRAPLTRKQAHSMKSHLTQSDFHYCSRWDAVRTTDAVPEITPDDGHYPEQDIPSCTARVGRWGVSGWFQTQPARETDRQKDRRETDLQEVHDNLFLQLHLVLPETRQVC